MTTKSPRDLWILWCSELPAAVTTQPTPDKEIDKCCKQIHVRVVDQAKDQAVKDLVETIKEVIRNSPDIVAKKACSRALQKYEESLK